MTKPESTPSKIDPEVVGYVFDAPLVARGWSWIPLAQFAAWLIFSYLTGKRHPDEGWWKRFESGGLMMSSVLGSEWCHNLAHAAAAKWVGKPADEIRIVLGMPLLVYHDIDDQTVAPCQHIIRAIGGPLANIILLAATSFIKRFIKTETIGIEIVDAARNTNFVLLIAGLTPQPWLDGGAVLKWSLVSKGSSLEEAEKTVRKANYAAAAGFSGAAAAAFSRSKKAWGGLFAGLAVLSLGAASGLLREKT
jgi:hypothetical protein